LSPGSNATVNNTGTSTAAVFNFGIPAGQNGAQGIQGVNACTLSSADFTVPAVGSSVTATVQDASWVVVGQMLYISTAGGTPVDAGAMRVTAKTGNQLTLLNVPASPAVGDMTKAVYDTNNDSIIDHAALADATPWTGVTGKQLASASQPGLLAQLSGLVTDYVGGDNVCHGLVAALASLLVPTGAVFSFSGASAPNGFLLCDGAAVSRTTYAALYAVIGTTYGTGDGSTTFNLPDARGRTAIGAGQGAGLTNRVLAAKGGEETHQLTIAELASHTHVQDAHTHTTGAFNQGLITVTAGGYAVATWGSQLTGSTVATNQNTGGNGAHNTMPPFITFNLIIKT
jgi:microcystin-dependent protein